jgi:hypothetical protein
MTDLNPATLDARRALCAARVTLNGTRAIVTGARNPFASVVSLDGPQYDAEFSWAAAARVIAKGGAFKT